MKSASIVALISFSTVFQASLPAAAQAAPRSEPVRLVPPIAHTRYVADIQSSRRGNLAASCSWDGSAIVWETATGRIIRRLSLTNKGNRVRFVENDRSLLTVEDNSRIVLWDIETGMPRWTVKAPITIESVSVRPDSHAVAFSGVDPNSSDAPVTLIYRVDTGAVLQKFGAASEIGKAGITETLYSSDGSALYGCSALEFFKYRDTKNAPANPLLAFDSGTGKKRSSFAATGAPVAFSGDGKFLLTKGKGSAAWRDAVSGAVVRTFQREIKGEMEPEDIALSPDGDRFATVSNGGGDAPDGTIREYAISTGALLHKTTLGGVGPDHTLVYLNGAKRGENRKVLVTLNQAQEPFCQVDIARGAVVQNFRGGSGVFRSPTMLSPDGLIVFVPNGTETGIIGWDLTRHSTAHLFFFPDKKARGASSPLAAPAVSHDGSTLATPGVSDKHVFVSDLRSGTVTADIPVALNALTEGIALHPRGEWIGVSISGPDYRDYVKLFSPKGKLLGELRPPQDGTHPLLIRAVASDATGKRILISDYDGRLFIYDINSGALLRQIKSATNSNREAFGVMVPIGAQKDRMLLTKDSGQILEFDISTGQLDAEPIGDTVEGRVLAATTGDGRVAALGRFDGSILLWQRDSGTTTKLIGHTGRLASLQFSGDGRRLTSLGSDGLVRFWDTRTGREQASLFVFTRKPSVLSTLLLDPTQANREDIYADIPQWIVYDRNGFFDGSDGATRYIHFAKGMQTYSADQFFERFYRLGLLPSLLSQAADSDIPEPKNGIADSLRIGTPPLIRIVSPLPAGKNAVSGTVALRVEATEQAGGGVKAIRFYQNGRLIGGPSVLRGIAVEAVSGATTTKTFTVSLAPGENTFRAVAYSKSDMESIPATLAVNYVAPQIAKPNLYVLAVGINTYKDSAMNLSYARPDAESLAGFFEKGGSSPASLFQKVSVSRLTDSEATATAIASRLSAVAATAKPDDVVFLYFAGHGETADGSWYFLPYEMRQMALPERVKELGVPWSRIESAVGKIAARKIVLVVDACKSGAALTGALRGTDDEAQTMAVMARAQGIHILTASTGLQYAAEVKELGHGILTYALLEGLNGKATASGSVMVRSLMAYVEDRVPALSKQYRGSEQYPVPFERGQNFPLVAK